MIVLPNGNGLIYNSNLTTTNDDKTEFMLIETKQQLSKINIDCHCGKKFRDLVRL